MITEPDIDKEEEDTSPVDEEEPENEAADEEGIDSAEAGEEPADGSDTPGENAGDETDEPEADDDDDSLGATCEIEDTGPGIPPEERERVFERFYRQSPSGTGLGLSIVGEICRAHRAEISLHEGAEGGLLVRVSFLVE